MPALGCANVERTSTIYFDRALRSGPPFDTLFVAEQLPLDADRHQRHLLIVRSQNVAHYTHDIGINTPEYLAQITVHFLLPADIFCVTNSLTACNAIPCLTDAFPNR